MKKPVIGIFLDINNDSEKYSYASLPWYALRQNYAESVERAGGLPVMLPYNRDIDSVLDLIDGLIIPGCDEDINPRFYGREIISDTVKTKDERALYELEFTKKALGRNKPIFGICNGIQLINTVFGGTLIQHIPDHYETDLLHEQPTPKGVPSHAVIIEKGTVLYELSGAPEIMVNSTHHQAIENPGRGLVVSARAPDGIIEAVESQDYKFLIGVQWHAEYLNTSLDTNLYQRLIAASA